jgi:hypothetical protein
MVVLLLSNDSVIGILLSFLRLLLLLRLHRLAIPLASSSVTAS